MDDTTVDTTHAGARQLRLLAVRCGLHNKYITREEAIQLLSAPMADDSWLIDVTWEEVVEATNER